jgi:ribonuclease E
VRDNESLSLSILRLIEEEALKENTKEVHAIVPVPIASYLLNEKRAAVSAIEARQGGVRCIIVPNDQMETPHYSVLRVRKGEETSTLSYLLPKLHEEEMALPSDEEPAERKLPEQPAWRPLSCLKRRRSGSGRTCCQTCARNQKPRCESPAGAAGSAAASSAR